MRYGLVLVLLLALTVGCVANVAPVLEGYTLDRQWAPLEKVVQVGDVQEEGTTTTVGTVVYVRSLKQWLLDYPPGTPKSEALLLHERTHAVRQGNYGLMEWLARYVADPGFRWSEERVGWGLEIEHLFRSGLPVPPPEQLATWWHEGYVLLGRPMVSYEEGLAWAVQQFRAAGK